ncbi:MAG: hypothetical protein K6F99_03840 [Lachnospiraceae bacterium]|nr:hypothetical protein [Lachnospiraceae bacterium]
MIIKAGNADVAKFSQEESEYIREELFDFLLPKKTENGIEIIDEDKAVERFELLTQYQLNMHYQLGKEVQNKLKTMYPSDKYPETEEGKKRALAAAQSIVEKTSQLGKTNDGFQNLLTTIAWSDDYSFFIEGVLKRRYRNTDKMPEEKNIANFLAKVYSYNMDYYKKKVLNEEERETMNIGADFAALGIKIKITDDDLEKMGLDVDAIREEEKKTNKEFIDRMRNNYLDPLQSKYKIIPVNKDRLYSKIELMKRQYGNLPDLNKKVEFISLNARRSEITKNYKIRHVGHHLTSGEKKQFKDCTKSFLNPTTKYGKPDHAAFNNTLEQCILHYKYLHNVGRGKEADAFVKHIKASAEIINESYLSKIQNDNPKLTGRTLNETFRNYFNKLIKNVEKDGFVENIDEAEEKKYLAKGMAEMRDPAKLGYPSPDKLNDLSNLYDQFSKADRKLHINSSEYKKLRNALKKADELKNQLNGKEMSEYDKEKMLIISKEIETTSLAYLKGKGVSRSTEMGEDRYMAALSALHSVNPQAASKISKVHFEHNKDYIKAANSLGLSKKNKLKQPISMEELENRAKMKREDVKEQRRTRARKPREADKVKNEPENLIQW